MLTAKATKPRDVDEYIAKTPIKVQAKLREVRAAILEVAPAAEERISYMMPCYNYKGQLAWFGFQRNHIGLYVRPPIISKHKKELLDYVTTKSAVHLELDKPIPVPLIQMLVKARMKLNEESPE